MGNDQVDTIVIGAGQAGIATSEHLSKHGIDHLVLSGRASPKNGGPTGGIALLQMVLHGMIDFLDCHLKGIRPKPLSLKMLWLNISRPMWII